MTKKERYVLARLNGAGVREAAKSVGYAGGAPPPGARKLCATAERVKHRGDLGAYEQRLKKEVTEMEFMIAEKQRELEAARLAKQARQGV